MARKQCAHDDLEFTKSGRRETLLNINVAARALKARDLQQAGFLYISHSHKSTAAMTTLHEFTPLKRAI